jgi:hypothetical protein
MDDSTRAALFAELDFERLAGTPGEARAAEVLIRRLKAMGLEPSLEPFPVNSFRTGSARLSCGPDGWHVHPYGLQGDCNCTGWRSTASRSMRMAKPEWWTRCVPLELEAKKILARERSGRLPRRTRAT